MSKFGKQLIRFIFVGVCAVSIDFLVYWTLLPIIIPTVSKGISFLAGTLLAYVLNKNWTFEQDYSSSKKFKQFLTLYAITFLVNIGVHYIMIQTYSSPLLAFVSATAMSTCLNFIGQKFWVFEPNAIKPIGTKNLETTLSLIIPCYNEEKNLPLILERLKLVIKRDDIEVILVDNGSLDDTEHALKMLLPKYSFARSVKVPINEGYGHGIMSGLRSAKGEFLAWTHADMQTDPHDVIKALEIMEQQPVPLKCFIKGNRKKRPFFDTFFTVGMSIFETLFMFTTLWDINAQPNLFHRSFFEGWENPPKDFSFDLYALYQAKKKKIEVIRFPVEFPERVHGQSSWNTGLASKWKFIKRTVSFSWKLKKVV